MEYTDIVQDCYGVSVSDTVEEFRIETTVQDAGELPTPALFVYSIGDTEDVATDSFSRVGNPQDIQNLLIDRDAAIAASDAEYLSSFMAIQYPDLDVAIRAKAMLATRINDLVKRWINYADNFVADSNESKLYPIADTGVEDALREDYSDAKEAREAAEIVAAAAATAKDEAEAAITVAEDMVDAYQECVDFMSSFVPQLNTYHLTIVNEGTEAASLWSGVDTTLTTRSASCNASLAFWSNTKSARTTEFQNRITEKIGADTALVAAEAAEDEALAAVLAVCPDFDPASV